MVRELEGDYEALARRDRFGDVSDFDVSLSEARGVLAHLVNRAAYREDRIRLVRRGKPVAVLVGIDEGLKHDSAVKLDQIQTVDQKNLAHFVGTVGDEKMTAVCRALWIATGCEISG